MTVVANNNTNNNSNAINSVVERSDSASPVADAKANAAAAATVDLLEQPYGNLERAFQAKLRNLEKRRSKLQQKSEQASKGVPLTNEQRDALTKAVEVDQQIEYIRELSKLLEKQQKLYQRARKDALRKQKLMWTEKTAAIDANNTTPAPTPTETEKAPVAEAEASNDVGPEAELNGGKTHEKPAEDIANVDSKPKEINAADNQNGQDNAIAAPTDFQNDDTVKPVEPAPETNEASPQSEARVNGHSQLAAEQTDVAPNGHHNSDVSNDAQLTENIMGSTAENGQANGANRRPHGNRRSGNYKRNDVNGQQGSGPNGRSFHPRGHRNQRPHNNRQHSKSAENGHAPVDVAADSSEGEFVKPATFIRRKNVEDGLIEANGNVQTNGNGHANGHRGPHNGNYHGDGRPAYRKPHRGQHSPQADSSNRAPAVENGNGTVENGSNDSSQNGQHDGQTVQPPRQYANNNGNGYRRPPRQYDNNNRNVDGVNGSGRSYRPRSGYGSGNGRNYENDNNGCDNNYNNNNGGRASARGNYYKQTATYRQPLECGFVFAAD